jgi:prepilin-type N-terminal cleavage/methylation domain-containing protein
MSSSLSFLKRRAFTLIELLVVISIIAILAAILFPVFAQAKAAAKKAACISNTKQVGIGFTLYLTDNDDFFPLGNYSSFSPGAGWAGAIYPYGRNAGILHCPEDPTGSLVGSGPTFSKAPVSYFYNSNISKNPGLASFTATAVTILTSEDRGDQAETSVNGEWSGAGNAPSDYSMSMSSDGLNWIYYRPDGQMVAPGPVLKTGGCEFYTHDGAVIENPIPPTPYSIWSVRTGMGQHSSGKGAVYGFVDSHAKYLSGDETSCGFTALNSSDGPDHTGFHAAGTGNRFVATFSTN